MWLLENNFTGMVSNKWISLSYLNDRFSGNIAKNFVTKLRELRLFLKKWNKDVFGNVKVRKENILFEMLAFNKLEELRPLTNSEKNVLSNLKEELIRITTQEEVMWRQRSRIQWMDEGDKNTKFFHKVANGRKRSNTINSLLINNVEILDQNDLNNAFTNYYKDIFGTRKGHRIRARWNDLYPTSTRIILDDLDSPFSEDEILTAINDMPSDKAPGPDGFPVLFYKKFWNVLKFDLIKMFNEFYDGSLQLGRFNFANVILLHKKIDVIELKDFRPISLINSSFKIISKVLANRLNSKMNDLIDSTQTAFIKGRNITDGVAVVQEFINHGCINNITCTLLKLDFAKAFDSIDWLFLKDLLIARGFSDKWVGWIMSLLTTGNSSIMVNGILGNKIQSKRGLRQGDPLSPLLFNLAADVFARIIKLANRNGVLANVGNSTASTGFPILQFADDTLLFYFS